MKIVIDHIARIEGHAGFIGKIINGKITEAKIETQEGARLFESLLIGRHYFDAPVITARICGVCPVIHNLTSIKAIENAFDITPHPLTVDLRRLMLAGQTIQSHVLHLYFLVIADYFNMESGIDFARKYPADAEAFLDLREFGNNLIKTIGGRSIHPLTPEVGGFTKLPEREKLNSLLNQLPTMLAAAQQLLKIIVEMPIPNFSRHTEYLALHDEYGYFTYTGKIHSSLYNSLGPEKFIKQIREIETVITPSKRVTNRRKSYMVGAIARLNLNHANLNVGAKRELEKIDLSFPNYNPFNNNIAQAIEIIHLLEKTKKILEKILPNLTHLEANEINTPYKPKTSHGTGALEAPRGTLFHSYGFDKNGLITSVNIITPTVQSLGNLENDLKAWIQHNIKASHKIDTESEKKLIMMLIRAYDPCITCATH